MEFEVISYPEEIKPNTEYDVQIEVTPGWLGIRTDDWIYFHESGIKPTDGGLEKFRSGNRLTTIHHKSHSNKVNTPYNLSVVIELHHVAELTEQDMVLSIATYNGQYDPFLSALFGGEGVRIHYSKEGDTYYATGEIEKSY
jgi:hypothetical protein